MILTTTIMITMTIVTAWVKAVESDRHGDSYRYNNSDCDRDCAGDNKSGRYCNRENKSDRNCDSENEIERDCDRDNGSENGREGD